MGTPNRLGIILGSAKVDVDEIQPKEWLKIIDIALQECRPQLKYFPEFKPIGDELNCTLNAYDERVTDLDIVIFPKDFGCNTRCVEVANISHEIEGENPAGPMFGVHFYTERTFLLTQKGQLILWERKYARQIIHGLGFRSHRTGTKEVAKLCRFDDLMEDELQRLFSSHKGLGLSILQSLCSLVVKGVEYKTSRLVSMQKLQTFLHEVKDKIETK